MQSFRSFCSKHGAVYQRGCAECNTIPAARERFDELDQLTRKPADDGVDYPTGDLS